MTKLNTAQQQKVAALLLHFSNATNSELLGRFDRPTRNRIRQAMSDLSESEHHRSNQSLNEFADFIYFKPQSLTTSASVVQPRELRPQSAASSEPKISFLEIVRLPDDDLDKLLQAAPAELTLKALCCSPKSFVKRVIERLSDEDAELVRKRIEQANSIDHAELQQVHHDFCCFASDLIQQGQLDSQPGTRS